MKNLVLISVVLAFSVSQAEETIELRGPSDIEIEAAIISELEVARNLTESNPSLSVVERDLALAQIDAMLDKANEDISDILAQKREIETASGNKILVAVSVGLGGSASPLKINLPKWIPAIGVGGDLSVGLMTAFTKGPERLKFSGYVENGFHASVLPKTGKFLSKKRGQVFLTIKLFFATPFLNPVSKRYELIDFSDLNRTFYGGGKDSGWNVKLPRTNLNLLKDTTSIQLFGAWLDEEESPENEVQIDDSWWSRVGTYSLNLVESRSPDIIMASINIDVKKNDDIGNSYQFGIQKIRTIVDNNKSGDSFWHFLSELF